MDTLSAFCRASETFAQRVELVNDDQWRLPTPCTEWDVRALVNHIVGEYLWVPELMAGQTIADVGDKYNGDVLGENPKAKAAQACALAQTAFNQPGALERTVHLSYGDFPAKVYLGHMTIDSLIHAWDLARAIGADATVDEELAQTVYDLFAPQAEEWRSGGILAPAVVVPPSANALNKLIGLSGRQP